MIFGETINGLVSISSLKTGGKDGTAEEAANSAEGKIDNPQ